MQEVDKLYASVGFRIDTKSLDLFHSKMDAAEVKIMNFAKTITKIETSAQKAVTPVNNLLRALDFKGKSTGISTLANALDKLGKAISKIDTQNFHSKIQKITYALDEARPKINKNANSWERYAKAVERARAAFGAGSWAGRAGPPAPHGSGNPAAAGAAGAIIGSRYSSSPHYTPQSRLLAPMTGSHIAYLASGGVMAGVGAIYATKATLDRAQENLTAENFVKMASANDEEFKKNKAWLWERSNYYGTDINANMEGFGKIYMNTIDSLGRELSLKVIEDVMKYNTAMHTSKEAQKFINKSLYQMAGTAQVNAQDYNQWEEHVAGGNKVASRALDIMAEKGLVTKDWRSYGTAKKAISEIKIQGKDIVPALTQAMAEASAKGLETGRNGYQAESLRFQNRVTEFARNLAEGGLFDMAKQFFKLLNSIMELMKDMMPVWNAISKTIGFFFENIANGLQYLKEFSLDMAKFITWVYSGEEATYALRGVLTALAVSTLPLVLAGFKRFMTAVTMIMMKNPITAALIAILTVLGFLYGQWKRQEEGLSNWFDFFGAVLYLVKETFLKAIYTMEVTFLEFIVTTIEAFKGLPAVFTEFFDTLRDESKFIDGLIGGVTKLMGLQDDYYKRKQDREREDIRLGREGMLRYQSSPADIPQYQAPTPNRPALNATLDVQPVTLKFHDEKGRPLGQTQVGVANAASAYI